MSATTGKRAKADRRARQRAEEPTDLPPLSEVPNRHLDHARPDGATGRMKPTKARTLLRRMAEEHDAEEDVQIVAGLDALLAQGRG